MVVPFEHGGDGVGFFAGAGEDHDGFEIGLFEKSEEEFIALIHGDGVEGVGDGGGDFAACDLHFGRIGEAPFGELLNGGWHGGGEEESLSIGGRGWQGVWRFRRLLRRAFSKGRG